jgi:hypothetical protein
MTDEASHIQKYPVERPSGEVRADLLRLAEEEVAHERYLHEHYTTQIATIASLLVRKGICTEDEYLKMEEACKLAVTKAFDRTTDIVLPAEAATDAPE